ncbi:MAG TPA: hypothetical protein VGL34_11840 [Steroidobacteraceae bacterium]
MHKSKLAGFIIDCRTDETKPGSRGHCAAVHMLRVRHRPVNAVTERNKVRELFDNYWIFLR